MDSEPSRPPDGTDPLEGHGRLSHDLELREVVRGRKPGSPYVRIMRARVFRRRGPGLLEATPRAGAPRGRLARLWAALRRLVIGPPLATSAIVHERLTKVKALAVFSSDALSSSAYATEEILLVLVLAGTGALSLSLPIAAVIAGLLVIVAVSYSQTIRAYPTGGGSYLVAKENLGLLPGLVAGSALMVDYVLTVAVSIAAGTAAIIAAFPELAGERVPLAVGAVVLIALINFRGIRESGTIFAIPTYFFIVAILGTIAVGAARQVLDLGPAHLPEGEVAFTPGGVPQELTLFLVLRAFASGCAALTGIEAIADGVPAFKPPEPRNAVITLGWMAAILATLFLGITVLARVYDIVPRENETVVSQIAHAAFGTTPLYYGVQAATALILVLAANTSYADFPRLASIMARDGTMPHQFTFRGDRLAFTNGILLLSVLAGMLLIVFGGDTHRLIPLYAVGVFLSFTLSQSGMVLHHRKLREPNWRAGIVINGFGACATAVVAVVIAVAKFREGAWIVVLLIPAIVFVLYNIYRHYRSVAEELALGDTAEPLPPAPTAQRVVVPVGGLNRAVVRTLAYAKSISDDVTAVHVATEEGEVERLRAEWQRWGGDVPLVIIESPYRTFLGPLLAYIDALDAQRPGGPITVVIPEFIPKRWWQQVLHNQTALRLRTLLHFRPNTVVVDVPYRLQK